MASPYVVEIMEHDFESAVLLRSHDVPVLVDFWAPWCGPCKVIGPILEKLVEEVDGAFDVIKINIDENQRLAEALRITSIPTIFLFKDGRPVDAFQGALPESDIRALLAKHVPAFGPDAAAEAQASLSGGDVDDAKSRAEALLVENPDDARARLILAKIALAAGDVDGVNTHLDAIPETADEAREIEPVRAALAFRDGCTGSEDELRARVEANEDDLDARYALGCCLAAAGRYGDALEVFLESVKRDKSHADEAARKAMVTIFGLLGDEHDDAMEYRRQLAIWM